MINPRKKQPPELNALLQMAESSFRYLWSWEHWISHKHTNPKIHGVSFFHLPFSNLPITPSFPLSLPLLPNFCSWGCRTLEMICCASDIGPRRGAETMARKIPTTKTKTTALTKEPVSMTSSGLCSFPSLVLSACYTPSSSLAMATLVQSILQPHFPFPISPLSFFILMCSVSWVFLLVSSCFAPYHL